MLTESPFLTETNFCAGIYCSLLSYFDYDALQSMQLNL